MALRPVFAASAALLVMVSLGLGAAGAAGQAVAATAAPGEVELVAGADSSITLTWDAVSGATSYRVYRGTAAGGESSTPVTTTTKTTFTDTQLSTTPIYFYQVTAVASGVESARSPEEASKTPPPISTGGAVAGVPSGSGMVYYAKDARLAGFDWFQTLTGWFPQVLGSSGASSPNHQAVDMAYSTRGSMTFTNVSVPTAGLYTIDVRYAFASGLFPGITNRPMGLRVNGTVITSTQRFLVTGNFETYQHSALQARLNAGVNSISQFAVTDHGVARIDSITVTPATASVPSQPTALTATRGTGSVTLSWTRSASGNPTSYAVFRGTKADGESTTALGTPTGTTFTDSTVHATTKYFYYVVATNSVGTSPTTTEISIVA